MCGSKSAKPQTNLNKNMNIGLLNVSSESMADIDMADLDGDLLQIEGDLIKPNNQQSPEKPAHTRHCNCKSKR